MEQWMSTNTYQTGQSFPELTPKQKLILESKICPYCGSETELIDSGEIYGHSYGPAWMCKPCGAYVGCHPNTTTALGRVANAELRKAKRQAHKYFDLIWKNDLMRRYAAYGWLSEQLGLPREYTHIGMFKIETCNRVAQLSYQYLKQKGQL